MMMIMELQQILELSAVRKYLANNIFENNIFLYYKMSLRNILSKIPKIPGKNIVLVMLAFVLFYYLFKGVLEGATDNRAGRRAGREREIIEKLRQKHPREVDEAEREVSDEQQHKEQEMRDERRHKEQEMRSEPQVRKADPINAMEDRGSIFNALNQDSQAGGQAPHRQAQAVKPSKRWFGDGRGSGSRPKGDAAQPKPRPQRRPKPEQFRSRYRSGFRSRYEGLESKVNVANAKAKRQRAQKKNGLVRRIAKQAFRNYY